MQVRELIKIFREEHLPGVDSIKANIADKKQEATLALLRSAKVDERAIAYFESMPLWKIRGVGPAKALELWSKGVRPTNLQRYKRLLPEITQITLDYNFVDRIPHDDVLRVATRFMPTRTNWMLAGSYRRNKPTCGDVDILYFGPDLERLLAKLSEVHGDRWYVFSRGPSKISGVFTINGEPGSPRSRTYEVDLWIANRENKHAMLLYATGSKHHNVIMRHIARLRGMMLNQYGLFDLTTKKQIPTRTERDIYARVGMRYKTPEKRN